ncbi:heat shock 70 kDa protein-like [Physella acuta]|uniref:heat shock 70 kDa protein-like n=1 Tax=Physella acuta TaxID=109671 RepID=UPI0027DDCC1A|nr:heat shock 70 kDa protein-like [Physella acuta]
MALQSRVQAIGIDLGTTNSCVAVFHDGQVEIIADEDGNRTVPSYVSFHDDDRLVGQAAKAQASMNPKNTIYDVKRLIGRRFSDRVVKKDLKNWPFRVVEQADTGMPLYKVRFKREERTFSSEQISAMILGKMCEVAQTHLGLPVTDVVITVPAYFNDSQRQATKDAALIAGLNVLRIINEPTAAAIAYGLDLNSDEHKYVLIFDLGGGTFDVSVLSVGHGKVFETLSSAGDSHLGGEDFDNKLVEFFVEEFLRKTNKNLTENPRSIKRLKIACEQAKRTLSLQPEATVEVDSIFEGLDLTTKISRARFEELCRDLFQSTLTAVEVALQDARLNKEQIQEVVLVGGSTRIPRIQELLREFFDGKQLNNSINPDEAVAYGAAVQAALIAGDTILQDVQLVEVAPLSLGVEAADGTMSCFVKRGTPLPVSVTSTFTTYDDYQQAVTIQVFEGERALTEDNNLLGVFELTEIPPAPRGVPKIEVTFDIDSDGILSVTAKESVTGKFNTVVISNNKGRLSKADIKRLKLEAAQFRADDKDQRERVELRDQLEALVYSVRHAINTITINLAADLKRLLLQTCDETMTWLESNLHASTDEVRGHLENLRGVCEGIDVDSQRSSCSYYD